MRYPFLRSLPRQKRLLNAFYGYEHRQKVRPGAFYDMKNLSAAKYPLMSTRPDRLQYFRGVSGGGPQAQELIIAPDTELTAAATVNDSIVLCSRAKVYYFGNVVTDAALDETAENRQIIPFGRNFFVVPDGKYVVTDENGVKEVLHAAFDRTLPGASLRYADETGETLNAGELSATAPLLPEENDLWTDTSGGTMVLKRYINGAWTTMCNVCVRIDHETAGRCAAKDDRLVISPLNADEFEGTVLKAEEDMLLLKCKDAVFLPTQYIVRIEKRMPPLDLAVEHGNRIWGCRFGKNKNGEFVNEIYASALGDPTRWETFAGLSTDSYAASLGCPGAFTGAAVVGGDVIFFKEDWLIRVSGVTPQDFTVQTLPASGVAGGCRDTCVNLNEKLFYLSAAGVAVYDGALPYVLSRDFPTRDFTDTLGLACDGKYYLAAARNGERRLYVYDTRTGLWHVEDDESNVRFFVKADRAVCMLCRRPDQAPRYRLVALDAENVGEARNLFGPQRQGEVYRFDPMPAKTWFAETGQLLTDNGTSVLRGLVFRLELGEGAVFRASLRCGGSGAYIPLCCVKEKMDGAFSVPVNTPRCQSFSLLLEGEGGCTVYSIAMLSEKTGEVRDGA